VSEQCDPVRVFRLLSAHQAEFPIRTTALVLKISASGDYAWRNQPASRQATADADLTRRIRAVHAGPHGTYGAPHASMSNHSIGPSTGSLGGACDSAMCERLFATLGCEPFDRHRFRSRTQTRRADFHFIEGFHNPSRRHSALAYLSPIEVERNRNALNNQTWATNRPPNRRDFNSSFSLSVASVLAPATRPGLPGRRWR
jgi:hypothetical protein